jgi:predicted lysophospholipase L1 biosynthesis ABC-type transport system permease subunit
MRRSQRERWNVERSALWFDRASAFHHAGNERQSYLDGMALAAVTAHRLHRHRRTNEIGVRMALGAGRAAIARLILRETALLVAVGAAVGLLLALAGGRAAATLLFGVRPNDPVLLPLTLVALAGIALLASYAPARRATRIEPVSALRAE